MLRPRLAMPVSLIAIVLGPSPARAADITLSHTALERLVWQTLLTEGGRAYFEGGPEDTCRYAFIQEPKVSGEAGRLQVRFLFAGRAGTQIGQRCVGPGDNLDIVVSGVPALSDGEILLDDLKVEAPDTPYFRLVSGLVESQLRQRLRYPLRTRLDGVAALAAAGGVTLSVDRLEMNAVRVDSDAVHLSLELSLNGR